MLGESPATGPYDVESEGPLSLDYYRNKVREFQQVINALDETGRTVDALIREIGAGELADDLIALQSEFADKKTQIKIAAEAINFAASGANAIGIRFPQLSLPQTLGAAPIVAGAAIAAAVAAAAGIIVWGREWIIGVNQRLRDAELLGSVPEADRAKVAEAILKTEVAVAQASESPLASVASIVKWVAIGVAVFYAYEAFKKIKE
jgi:hypothetical protein